VSRQSRSRRTQRSSPRDRAAAEVTRRPPIVPVAVVAAVLLLAGLVATLALGGPGGSPAAQAAGPLPAEVNLAEGARMRDAGAFVLDVREPNEWDEYHVPGSTLIPLGELASRASEVPADREVLVVCRSGNRSATGRDILLAAGHGSVTSLAGGLRDWQAAGYPTVTGP
jgi:rhodanese-related sulfurtransferase